MTLFNLQASLTDFIAEVKRRSSWKSSLREANVAASEAGAESDLLGPSGKKLDSSLKKNTAFIRKLVSSFFSGKLASSDRKSFMLSCRKISSVAKRTPS